MPAEENDGDDIARSPLIVDARGQAALLLIESLIHGMIERSMLTSTGAIKIIEGAVDLQGAIAEAADGEGASMWLAQSLLKQMSASLAFDLDDASALTQ